MSACRHNRKMDGHCASISGSGRGSSNMSAYRPLKRAQRRGVRHATERSDVLHRRDQEGGPRAGEQVWTRQRKARPAGFLFPTTMRWIASLPSEFRPMAIGEAFPRIANALASRWSSPDAFTNYLDDLLTDRRGGRLGFPTDVLAELHALSGYYSVAHP